MIIPSKLEIGLRLGAEETVRPEWSASKMGNPGIEVFSTPALVGLLEVLAHECLPPALEPGQGTAGTRVKISHLAATPIGMKVRTMAKVARIESPRVLVRVEARDERDQIASRTIVRYVLGSVPRFVEKVAAKARGMKDEKRSGLIRDS